MRNADIIILLISADFLDSHDCMNQAALALKRSDTEQSIAVPVIVRDVNWRDSSLGKLQPLLANEKPINAWEDSDEAYSTVAQKIYAFAHTITIHKRNMAKMAVRHIHP